MRGKSVFAAMCLVLGFGAWCVAAELPQAITLYVAPNGNDAWSGSAAEPNADGSDGPLATLAGARDAVRRLKEADTTGSVRVLLRGGTYFLKDGEPVVFGPEDSGGPAMPITYAAYPEEKPVISGGEGLTGWRQEGNFWVADVPEGREFRSLWVNGERRTVARTPNEGYFRAAGKAPEGADAKTTFVYRPEELPAIKNLHEDAVFVVYHSWATSLQRVKSLDEQNHLITFTGPARWPFGQWEAEQRYHIEGVIEALDAPGEWCLDTRENRVYYMPLPGEDMATAEVMAPLGRQLVVIQGDPKAGRFVRGLNFEGISFRHTDIPLPPEGYSDSQAAISVRGTIEAIGARFCSIRGCEVAQIGPYGIWLGLGSQDNMIAQNEVADMGAGGVAIGEPGDPGSPEEAVLRNRVDNNFIHDGGKILRSAVGVWIGKSSFNTVSHNEISDLLYTGVSVGWSWGYAPSSANHNVIEYNHIHRIGQGVLSDMGGIYTLGVAPGTTLRYNLIHDVQSYSYGGWGIYPDEGSSYLLIENNVVYDTKTGGFHQHYGRGNVVTNNVFAFAKEDNVVRTREEEHTSFFFERNIVIFDNGRLLGSNWSNNNFWIDSNVYWDTSNTVATFKGKSFEEWKALGHDVNSVIADPLFVDAAGRDFTLKPESPALGLGFRPIDIGKAGLYGPAEWVSKPEK